MAPSAVLPKKLPNMASGPTTGNSASEPTDFGGRQADRSGSASLCGRVADKKRPASAPDYIPHGIADALVGAVIKEGRHGLKAVGRWPVPLSALDGARYLLRASAANRSACSVARA